MPQTARRRRVTFEWYLPSGNNELVDESDRCGVTGRKALMGKVFTPQSREERQCLWWWLVRTEDDRLCVCIPAYGHHDEVLVTYAADPEYIAQAVRALCDRVGLLM